MERRQLLRALGMGASAVALQRCAAKRVPVPGSVDSRASLRKVLVSPDRIIRGVAGLRPFRPSGFVVKAEKIGEKLCVHNYGHGGSGITLSWGTASLAVEEAMTSTQKRMAVLGCGAVGLATARLLQQRGIETTIYAKSIPPDTTSNIAGGLWYPAYLYKPGRQTQTFTEQFLRAIRFSHRYFQLLVGNVYGVRWLPNYFIADHPFGEKSVEGSQSPMHDLFPGIRDLEPDEHPFPFRYVRRFYLMLIEPQIYLRALSQDFGSAGGKVIIRELRSREEIASLPEPVVINCTGLGSKALLGDNELIPVKGQLTFLLPQPEVDYTFVQGDLYMFPRGDGILLGGTHEEGVWDLNVDLNTQARILAGHASIFSRIS